jgi:hypothetical protein
MNGQEIIAVGRTRFRFSSCHCCAGQEFDCAHMNHGAREEHPTRIGRLSKNCNAASTGESGKIIQIDRSEMQQTGDLTIPGFEEKAKGPIRFFTWINEGMPRKQSSLPTPPTTRWKQS